MSTILTPSIPRIRPPAALGALRFAALAVAMAVLGCQGDTAAPKPARTVLFSMVPQFQSSAASAVPFDRVRVALNRLVPRNDTLLGVRAGTALDLVSSGPNTALDTVVDFPPGPTPWRCGSRSRSRAGRSAWRWTSG